MRVVVYDGGEGHVSVVTSKVVRSEDRQCIKDDDNDDGDDNENMQLGGEK